MLHSLYLWNLTTTELQGILIAVTMEVEQPVEVNDNEAPKSKRLRSHEPDLKVILRYEDSNGEPVETECHEYSQVLATMSKFVDASLSVEMREKQTGEIIFHDVTPDIFTNAIGYLKDPQQRDQ